jgi:hypothetical protein
LFFSIFFLLLPAPRRLPSISNFIIRLIEIIVINIITTSIIKSSFYLYLSSHPVLEIKAGAVFSVIILANIFNIISPVPPGAVSRFKANLFSEHFYLNSLRFFISLINIAIYEN